MNKVFTVTFGDVAENHARMQKIGVLANNGYSTQQIDILANKLSSLGLQCELVNLSEHWAGQEKVNDAHVLVIRRGAQFILRTDDTKLLMEEHERLPMDKKAFMRGRVVNKHARWNLCFADYDQEPSYEEGKGRIVDYKHIPLTQTIRQNISEWMEDGLLNGEANYYYDIKHCGIGYHGDGERRKVFAVRMGASMPLYFQWYLRSEPVGERVAIQLNDGDMYVMSEKSVGFDWLKKTIPTLRHSTGCDKFTNTKK